MKITFAEPSTQKSFAPKSGALVVGVGPKPKLAAAARRLDSATNGALSRAMSASRFSGKEGQLLEILAPEGISNPRVLLVGIGDGLNELELENLGGRVLSHLNRVGESTSNLFVDAGAKDLATAAARIAYGARLASYRFDQYRTKESADSKPTLRTLTVRVKGAANARRAFQSLDKVADGVFMTRDLVSQPPNVLFPKSFANEAKTLTKLGVKVEVLGEKQMAKLGMETLLAVGRGSEQESQLAVMRWNGAGRSTKPVAFVGKGVTFDTGGISLKPGAGMEEMKWDMGGAGAVTGLMKALAGRKAKVNAIGVIGLVENMPDGRAQRPGDIVTSMSGQTIEVINTDAEGRLVLADALWYTQKRFKPQFMIDLATLTGAIIIGLGHEHAGLFSNDDALSDQLAAAGRASGEKVWRLPLDKAYDKMLDCPAADMKNIGGRSAGSITAAQFLQRFVNDSPWAHLDIAGVAWSQKDAPTTPKGGTGFGVRLLDRFVRDNYEG
ncbi:MAG: leucyl aminopeptidase [Rhodospirillaceae bacterium]|jgi:leucyl aminopeptidase|nr:leucyl aminopeptidase [Rhodospirillaceae bacterium]MBT5666665.1 leucyl aminopeptidase [Rhodospirillaceae bacterium]